MRYRVTPDGTMEALNGSGDVIVATVGFTLLVGVLFVVVGIRARQRWLGFWGVLTCLCCAVYFLRGWLGLTAATAAL